MVLKKSLRSTSNKFDFGFGKLMSAAATILESDEAEGFEKLI